jgi:hypothetical protein
MLTCEALVTPITKQYLIHTCECSETYNNHAKGYKPLHISNRFPIVKALPGFFLCIFSSLTCLKKPVFSKRDLLQWKVPASLSLFLKSERIPALLYPLPKPHLGLWLCIFWVCNGHLEA